MKRALNYTDYKHHLAGKYLEAFEMIESYCGASELSAEHLSECLDDLLDLILTAQKDGVSVKKITGENIEAFCGEYIRFRYPKRYIMNLLKELASGMWIILIFTCVGMLILVGAGEENVFTGKSDIGAYFIGILSGVFIFKLSNLASKRVIFKWFRYRKIIKTILVITMLIIFYAVLFLAVPQEVIVLDVQNYIALAICAGYLVLYYAVIIMSRLIKKESIFGKKNANKTVVKIDMITDVMCKMIPDLIKRFHKKNIKREKRGQYHLTEVEFMEFFRKETKQTKIASIISYAFCAVIYGGTIIQTAMTSTLIDTLIFSAIVIPIGSFIMYPFILADKARQKLMKKLDDSGKTIFDEDICDYLRSDFSSTDDLT